MTLRVVLHRTVHANTSEIVIKSIKTQTHARISKASILFPGEVLQLLMDVDCLRPSKEFEVSTVAGYVTALPVSGRSPFP